ncbi:hypothetical protein [Bacteroides cellulosilyticus]|uniref:hypothetical protein n=1 Tax=Bacteroides cellulosilyticus TaxID=246787 RepID=UPI00374E0EB1
MGWPMAPKLLLRMMARCSGGEIRNWRRLKSNPSRLRFTPSGGGCIRQISSSVHSLRGWRKGATEEAGGTDGGTAEEA